MTFAGLVGGWVAVAILVAPPVTRRLGRIAPAFQAAGFLGAAVALVTIPVALAVTVLYRALIVAEMSGSILSQCGRLLVAVVTNPLARLDITLALLVVVLAALGIVVGAVAAWRSQARCHRLVARGDPRFVVLPLEEPVAFTTGFLRPRVVVSRGLEAAPERWRDVVLAHEEAHRRFRHPLWLLIAEALARGVPLHPVRWSVEAFRVALEMVADEFAGRRLGSRQLVAEVVAGIALAPGGVGVGFEGATVGRVRNLLQAPVRGRTALGVALVSGVLVVLSLGTAHAAHCANASVETLTAERCRVHFGARPVT